MNLTSCKRASGQDPTPVCTITLNPPNRTFSSEAAEGTITVETSAPSCAWTAVAGAPWLAIVSGSTGTGPGTVRYTVASNEAADARAGVVTVGDQAHSITQQGQPPVTCTYALVPPSATIDEDGGTGSFNVDTMPACAWTAQSNADWLTIVSGAEGSGPGTVTYEAAATSASTERVADIAVANAKFSLTQAGRPAPQVCTYEVDPTQFTPCMAAGTVTTDVTTQEACTWTVTSDAPWLNITTGGSGSGSGSIEVEYTENYDAPREGVVMVRWPTETAGQNVRVTQAGCVYGTSQTLFSFGKSGGTGSFNVVQQSQPYECGGPLQNGCIWSATSSVPWVTVTTSMPRTGDDAVSFQVAENPLSVTRSGTITVRDRVIQIIQAP